MVRDEARAEKSLTLFEDQSGEAVLIIVAPLNDAIDAWIRVIFSLKTVQQQDLQLIIDISFMTLLLIGAGMLSLQWSKNNISSLLQSVINQLQSTLASRTMSASGFSTMSSPVPITTIEPTDTRGDLEQLERTVTQTIGLLTTQSQALQHAASTLEKTVKERTLALLEWVSKKRQIHDGIAGGLITWECCWVYM